MHEATSIIYQRRVMLAMVHELGVARAYPFQDSVFIHADVLDLTVHFGNEPLIEIDGAQAFAGSSDPELLAIEMRDLIVNGIPEDMF